MKWFEPLIILAVVAFLVWVIAGHFIKKKKGTDKCECGKPRKECTGNCKTCATKCNKLVEQYKKSKDSNYVYLLDVHGMKCGECESHINETIRNNFRVKSVKSNRKTNETMIVSDVVLDVDKIKKCIEQLGYKVG